MGSAKTRERWERLKLCCNCGGPRDNKTRLCSKCYAYQRVQRKMLRQERYEKGLCVICGKPNDDGYKSCPECRRKNWEAQLKTAMKKDGC